MNTSRFRPHLAFLIALSAFSSFHDVACAETGIAASASMSPVLLIGDARHCEAACNTGNGASCDKWSRSTRKEATSRERNTLPTGTTPPLVLVSNEDTSAGTSAASPTYRPYVGDAPVYYGQYGGYITAGPYKGLIISDALLPGFKQLASGQPEYTFAQWMRLASSGDRGAQYNVGVMLHQGLGVDPDWQRAMDFLLEAGRTQSMWNTTEVYLTRMVQEALIGLGFLSGQPDGSFGPHTAAAFDRAVADLNLSASHTHNHDRQYAYYRELFDSYKLANGWRQRNGASAFARAQPDANSAEPAPQTDDNPVPPPSPTTHATTWTDIIETAEACASRVESNSQFVTNELTRCNTGSKDACERAGNTALLAGAALDSEQNGECSDSRFAHLMDVARSAHGPANDADKARLANASKRIDAAVARVDAARHTQEQTKTQTKEETKEAAPTTPLSHRCHLNADTPIVDANKIQEGLDLGTADPESLIRCCMACLGRAGNAVEVKFDQHEIALIALLDGPARGCIGVVAREKVSCGDDSASGLDADMIEFERELSQIEGDVAATEELLQRCLTFKSVPTCEQAMDSNQRVIALTKQIMPVSERVKGRVPPATMTRLIDLLERQNRINRTLAEATRR